MTKPAKSPQLAITGITCHPLKNANLCIRNSNPIQYAPAITPPINPSNAHSKKVLLKRNGLNRMGWSNIFR